MYSAPNRAQGSRHANFVELFAFADALSGVEGLEVNVLGLTFGINPFDPSLKLPLVGRIGPERQADTAVMGL